MKDNITLKEMVDTFIEEKRKYYTDYIEDMKIKAKQMSYEDYLNVVISCYPEHKWHFTKYNKLYVLKDLKEHLEEIKKQVLNKKSFDELLKLINRIKIEYVGELTIYDTALSLGVYLGYYPDKIFMHAGPKKAAKKIYGGQYTSTVKYLIKPYGLQYIDVNDLPKEFNELKNKPYLVEDCLCFIYSRYFKDNNE